MFEAKEKLLNYEMKTFARLVKYKKLGLLSLNFRKCRNANVSNWKHTKRLF